MADTVDCAPNLAGSRYAAALGRGTGDMRFEPGLEREYKAYYLAARHSHVRFFNTVMFALVALALLASLVSGHENTGPAQYLRVGTIAAAYLLISWIAHSRYFERAYLEAAHIASLLIALLAAVEIGYWINAGVGELFAILTVHSLGLYFLAGILFRGALQANIIMILALPLTLLLLGEPGGRVGYVTAILAGTGAIGGLAFRHQGIRFRRSFLEHGLISEMAERDGLTGLKNRRAFDEHLIRIWQQSLRDRRPLAIMLMDVDHFKEFNDRHGHQAGDDALKKIARVVGGFAKRPLDLAARFGGEEFSAILFDVPGDHAAKVAEQLRKAVQDLNIAHLGNEATGVVTISIGVAIVRPRLERSPEGVVQLADEALYAAKEEGRNRVKVFESEYAGLLTGRFKAQ